MGLFSERLNFVVKISSEYRKADLKHSVKGTAFKARTISNFRAIGPGKHPVKSSIHTYAEAQHFCL